MFSLVIVSHVVIAVNETSSACYANCTENINKNNDTTSSTHNINDASIAAYYICNTSTNNNTLETTPRASSSHGMLTM